MRLSWIRTRRRRSRDRAPALAAGLLAAAAGLLACAAPARAQEPADSAAAARTRQIPPVQPDSGALEWLTQEPAGVFLGWHRLSPRAPTLAGPRLTGDRLPPLHWTDLSGRWWHDLDARLARARDTLWVDIHGVQRVAGERDTRRLDFGPDSVRYLPYREPDTTDVASFLPGRVGQYADLGMLVTGRGEMGGAWQRFEPCDATGLNTCNQGIVPRMRPDLRFGVLVGGTITDRVHVAVDYDQAREFDAANNINVYYQGLEDEILQRFEMGDVTVVMPQSQFLGNAVPAGSFGFRALAQVGPLELQSVWAQQQGDIGALDINIDARTGRMFEENSITLDDHDYASGRFFFLVDPSQIADYPHIDILDTDALTAPDSVRPAPGTLQLYRDEQLPVHQREASRVFQGDAVPTDPDEAAIGGWFRRLDENDYVVHSSGLWIMLRQPLGPSETLAMSYVTVSGDTVGTIDAGAEGTSAPGAVPELRLLRGPLANHHPQASTWDYEMHQVYQVYAGDLEDADLDVRITLGDPAQGQLYIDYDGQQVPWLRLFGADENSPVDRVDPERLFLPSEFTTGTTTVTGTYLVFPTLRPFAEPPPTRGLSAEQAAEALGDRANERIYEERDPDLRSIARFRLVFDYSVRTDGLVSEFPLGGFGVREGSERITVDGVELRRGTDYTVDYETGLVRLTNPQQLFAGRQTPHISATFERSALFEIAPKSIFGTTARWRLGQAGEMNLVGLYQNQRSVMTRPQLGNEPNSIFMGGMTTNLRFDAGWMDRALDAIPGLRLAGESSVGMSGELAMSLPDPNTRGVAWIDDFEATSETQIPMNQYLWRLGSRPDDLAGTLGYMPAAPDAGNAFTLVWQHQGFGRGGTFGAFDAEKVDSMIATGGTHRIPESILYVSMREDDTRPEGTRVWRSMTSVLSTRGADLTSSEYLEFYVAEVTGDVALVIDVGTVSEDAFYIDSAGFTSGVREESAEPWGLGVFDQEAPGNQVWGVDLDVGLWDRACRSEPGLITVLGARDANCTVNNGANDSEDLNGDGVPNLEDGAYFRYVVPIGPNSPYLARDTDRTGSAFRLYRVPLRGSDAIPINGASDDTWRAIRHLRLTITSGNCTGGDCFESLQFARMRITGSTWKKREIEGVIDGLIGRDTIPGDHSRNVHVGPVSRLTEEDAYIGPPGTGDQASDPSQQFSATGVEVNEKGLRLIATDLEADARAEVFYRFPSETRSFMEYQQMRLWALPRAGDWGPDGTLSLLIKIGTDDGNYYMYRTRLRPPVENRNIDTRAYWLPEIVIDFEPWFELKAQAETNALQGIDGDTVFWNADSTHAIVLRSRAQAPNLAAIRELSLAVHNGAGLPADSAEVWFNDLRLGAGRSEAAFAGYVALDARAADFATMRVSFANQGPMFQSIGRDATYEGTNDLGVTGRFELGHFAPAGWGLQLPVTVQHNQQGRAPAFLNRTDIRASDLEGLRESGSHSTQVGLALSKATPASNPWLGLLVDGARLSLNWRDAERNEFTRATSSSQLSGTLNYTHQLQPRYLDVTPSFFVNLLRALVPARVEQSEFFRRLSGARLRWSPSDVGFSTSYRDQKAETLNFGTVLRGAADSAVVPLRTPQRDLENSATIGFRPFESLSARLATSSGRDLLGGVDLHASRFGQAAAERERTALGGLDLGWEKARTLSGQVEFEPRIASWLRPSVTWSTDYFTSRTPHYLEYEIETTQIGDSIVADTLSGTMQRGFQVAADLDRRINLDLAGLARAAWGDAPAQLGLVRGLLHRAMSAFLPIDLSWSGQVDSKFERSVNEPGYGYRFGLGSLEDLRLVAGDTAVTATQLDVFRARSGLDLPLGLQLDATYEVTDRDAISRQGSRNLLDEVTWPDVRLGIATLPIPAFARAWVARVSASAGYRVEETNSRSGSLLRDREAESIPLQFTSTFANGLTFSYNGTLGSSVANEPTGRRRGADRVHSFSLRTTFDAPESLGPKFDQPMTATLGYTYSSNEVCDLRPFGVGTEQTVRCAATVDRLSRDVHFTLETMIDQLNVGAQFSLNQHKSFVGFRDGSREFRLAIFANFNFGVGVLPQGMGAGRFGY